MDDADHAEKIIEQEMESMIRNSQTHLHQGNTTGLCIECGDEIPADRCKALPGCARCIECQSEQDWGF
ncbi:TraR/DksA C4-type zinc finger protein [Paremcibacter congregatus]|uniref:TraR/DksA C4-type zinc finger protein n=1 Tax=Paremcibacter congregatus TaxID=2043170 RepID=UPI003C6E31A9